MVIYDQAWHQTQKPVGVTPCQFGPDLRHLASSHETGRRSKTLVPQVLGQGLSFCLNAHGLPTNFSWGHAATPKTLPLAPCEFSLVTVGMWGVISEPAGYQSGVAVSGLAGVIRVARRGGMGSQPVILPTVIGASGIMTPPGLWPADSSTRWR